MPEEPDQRPRWWDLDRRLDALGDPPDPRFSLANERTFLAHIRTALALGAGAVALTVVRPDPVLRIAAVILGLLGTLLAGLAFVRWWRAESALRERRALPAPLVVPVISGVLLAVGVIVLVGLALRR